MRKILTAVLLSAIVVVAEAQSGTNSPYSQYGLGVLSDQTSGFNRGMNGLGIGFREHNQINFINPASYSSMDSLMFLFDAGVSCQLTNFNENGKKVNAKNADFEYVVAGFRAFKHVGVSFGLLPFSNVGYNYSASGYLNQEGNVSYTNTYSGTGGLHQVYFGLGWEPVKNFSIGANISYLWGEYERVITNNYSDSWVNTLSKYYAATVNSYKLDVGVQYIQPIGKKNSVTLGATFSPGHKLGADPECRIISTNSSTSVSDTTSYIIKNGLELPMMISGGVMWNHNNRLKIGADYTLQRWGSVSFPEYTVVNDNPQYRLNDSYFKDRHKVTLGGEFCKGEYSRNFFSRVRYRAGVSYATPYLQINGQDGPKELSVSAGFGIPIINSYNNRSMLNISGQWVRQSGKGMINENTFRINIGLTFNEKWFQKWKVQ